MALRSRAFNFLATLPLSEVPVVLISSLNSLFVNRRTFSKKLCLKVLIITVNTLTVLQLFRSFISQTHSVPRIQRKCRASIGNFPKLPLKQPKNQLLNQGRPHPFGCKICQVIVCCSAHSLWPKAINHWFKTGAELSPKADAFVRSRRTLTTGSFAWTKRNLDFVVTVTHNFAWSLTKFPRWNHS